MRIINFGVNNFRAISGGLENNIINFDGSNTIFIFGQNNVGKSTFLHAYQFLIENKVPTPDDFHKRAPESKMDFEVTLGVDEEDLRYIDQNQPTKSVSFRSFLNGQSAIKIKRSFTLVGEGTKAKASKSEDQTWDPNARVWIKSSFGSIGLITVFQELMPTPILIKAMPTEQEVEHVVNEILASKAKSALEAGEFQELTDAKAKISELQAKMYNPQAIDRYELEVNKHFQQLFPDTCIEIEDADKVKWTEDKFGKKFSIAFQKQLPDGTPDQSTPSTYNSIGHGAVRSAIFSLLLMRDIAEELPRRENRKEYLILFEEPELFLYPKILKNLRQLIYEVSDLNFPYQILCASHSPQMIDLSKRNSTLVRMVKTTDGTRLHQVKDDDLRAAKGVQSIEDLKHAMYEVLRFNPHICESFYADEVLLVEGPTEEIIVRGILQKTESTKDLFIVNCGTVNNIPFYQKVYRKFAIRSHVICDTDGENIGIVDQYGNCVFDAGVQKSIYDEHVANCEHTPRVGGLMKVHDTTFEVAHNHGNVHQTLRYGAGQFTESHGKPFNSNRYWKEILQPNFEAEAIDTVPIVRYVKAILNFRWN